MLNESSSQITQRQAMVERQLRGRGIHSEKVLAVLAELPRQCFVPATRRHEAYFDHPVPIGHGQTISQPYIVALMTESLKLTGCERVLEVGTGCGYQTAILARLAAHVCTIEIIDELSQRARRNIAQVDPELHNIEFHVGDGRQGWPKPERFDRILVAAAAGQAPPILIESLAEGGVMVAPVGPIESQQLLLIRRQDNRVTEEVLCYCRFVKLI
ncbi:MAG: protein-L-isoaspartate(D-aspartate) O-methyltransferase [Alphaproteobacteria bacterium]